VTDEREDGPGKAGPAGLASRARALRDRLAARLRAGGDRLGAAARGTRAAWSGWLARHPDLAPAARWAAHAAMLVLLVAATALYARHVLEQYGDATVDDAGITYAYADNVASGHGLRMTPGEAPTEGFSNPLQVLLLAPIARFTDDLDPASKGLNVGLAAAAFALLCAFVYLQLRGATRVLALLPLGLAVYWSGFNYWLAAGLEGGLLTALQLASLLALHYAPRHRAADVTLGVTAGLLAWTRPEGLVYGGIVVGVRLLRTPAGRRWLAAALFGGLVALLFGLRWVLFGDLVPNTFWAKVPGRGLWWSLTEPDGPGWVYLSAFLHDRWWYFAIPLWAAAPVWREAQALAGAALLQLLFAVGFVLYAGGDWMAEYRFLQPMMGPLAVLSAVGLVGLVGAEPLRRLGAGRLLLALGVLGVSALVAFGDQDWTERRDRITARRDIDLAVVAGRVPGYHELGRRLHLGRPPLVAEVDIGGLSYRSGLEILDLAGLADRALGLARTRRPALAPDYLYGERLPDVIHLHASWLNATPYHRLSGFRTLYRDVALPYLRGIPMEPVTAVRADLLDPPVRPALAVERVLPAARLLGFSAVPTRDGYVVAAHARQRPGRHPLPPIWRDATGRRFLAPWHGGVTLAAPVPPGFPVVALAFVPAAVRLPLTVEGTDLGFREWPVAPAGDRTAEMLARIPLLRMAGRDLPFCDPDRVLDPRADAASRARGAGFVARLCNGLPPATAERWRELAQAAAEAADSADDRWEAAAATLPMGLPQWLSTRLLLEENREGHLPFDEVLDAWARLDFAAGADADAGRDALGLRLLLAARRWSDVLLLGLAFGPGDPEVDAATCTAARRLGLRPDAVAAGLDCATVPDAPLPPMLRQSFEQPDDPRLRYNDGGSGTLRPVAMRRIHGAQREIGGGHHRLFVNSYDEQLKDAAVGSLVWGPLPWAGRRFGLLVGGGRDVTRLHVSVEGLVDGRWVVLGRLGSAANEEVLGARVIDLGPQAAEQVVVRVVDDSRVAWGHILADALTFIDVPVGE
jgi:hypothetical protein